MKNALFALLAGFIVNTASAAPADFVGSFKLVDQEYGMCDSDFTSVFLADGNLLFGSYRFIKINQGKQSYEDETSRSSQISYTTNKGELVQKVTTFNKTTKETYTDTVYVKIKGNKVVVKDILGQFPDLVTVCHYRKL